MGYWSKPVAFTGRDIARLTAGTAVAVLALNFISWIIGFLISAAIQCALFGGGALFGAWVARSGVLVGDGENGVVDEIIVDSRTYEAESKPAGKTRARPRGWSQ